MNISVINCRVHNGSVAPPCGLQLRRLIFTRLANPSFSNRVVVQGHNKENVLTDRSFKRNGLYAHTYVKPSLYMFASPTPP